MRADPGTGVLNQVSWDMAAGQATDGEYSAETPSDKGCVPVFDPFATTLLGDIALDDDLGTINLQEFADKRPTLPHPEQHPSRTRFFLSHRRSGVRIEVKGDEFVVGKSKYCSYQVKDTTTVSRRHAVFRCCDDACWIEDNGSTNGTTIDGVPLDPHKRFCLKGGEIITMSDEDFTFEAVRA